MMFMENSTHSMQRNVSIAGTFWFWGNESCNYLQTFICALILMYVTDWNVFSFSSSTQNVKFSPLLSWHSSDMFQYFSCNLANCLFFGILLFNQVWSVISSHRQIPWSHFQVKIFELRIYSSILFLLLFHLFIHFDHK